MSVQGLGGWQNQQPIKGTSEPKGTPRTFEPGNKPLKNSVSDASKAYMELIKDWGGQKWGPIDPAKFFDLKAKVQSAADDQSLIPEQRAEFQEVFKLLEAAITKDGKIETLKAEAPIRMLRVIFEIDS